MTNDHTLARYPCFTNRSLLCFRNMAMFGLALMLGISAQARAAEICIFSGNSAALAFWLENFEDNGQNDEIRLAAGTYDSPVEGFLFNSSEAYSLTISGGWNDDCSSTRGAGDTVIDGGGTRRLMRIIEPNGELEVRRIVWLDGYKDANGLASAGLQIVGASGTGERVTVELNQFIANENGSGGGANGGTAGGLTVQVGNGNLLVRNNLFVGNSGGIAAAAYLYISGSGQGFLVNNTVAANGVAGAPIGGIYLSPGASNPADSFIVSNNILWANVGSDLRIPANTRIYRNNIEDLQGVPNPSTGNNFSVDPLFDGGSFISFRLKANSPMIDAGLAAPIGGLTSVDLDGNTRVQNAAVDVGAYEFPGRIFADGFE